MPVHAIRVETSKVSEGVPIDTAINNLLLGLSRRLDAEEQVLTLHEPTDTEPLDEPYRAGLFRFDADDHAAAELLDTFENTLRGPSKWYRIRYHLCSHDLPAEERFPCEWDEDMERRGGPVPADLA